MPRLTHKEANRQIMEIIGQLPKAEQKRPEVAALSQLLKNRPPMPTGG